MGRQSARIYYQGQDHKDMVTWDGSKYVYHDKAYIWNSKTNSFQLVWEKYHGLKLLYESYLDLNPVSSENNKYLYFTEGNDGSVIYRIKINDKHPEKEEQYTSDLYTRFTAPRSSRGLGIYVNQPQYGYQSKYQILNLEDGTVHTSGTFNLSDYVWGPMGGYGLPDYTNQEVSQAESGEFASFLSSYTAGQAYQLWNFLLYVSPAGISAKSLDNREGTGSWINGRGVWDLGKSGEGTIQGLFPRFLLFNWNGNFQILEYGVGFNDMYLVTSTSVPPFDTSAESSLGRQVQCGVVRDGILPALDKEGKVWFINISNSISYEDTGIDECQWFDVSPDHKYILKVWQINSSGECNAHIIDKATKKIVMRLNSEECGMRITSVIFVGHKCLYVSGWLLGSWTGIHRLYKWR